ncbi:unnamed protein product [Mycena citricolor]|uniref:asparaginase n=1 Tax=Mycena citricolor TaxID=2018698 RepID=A0AAD2HML8_9AGAR|nr:unnamed protein product [Mycena citricolor]
MDSASRPSGNESRVLVIYTGGTIGMLIGNRGYVPEPFFLTETLKSQTRFHDPFQDSLFSNSGSVQGFRQFLSSTSGRSSPQSGNTPVNPQFEQPTLLSDKRPAGSFDMHPIIRRLFEARIPSLIMPRSSVSGSSDSKAIRYAILEWNPLLDSSNIENEDWIRLASEIELNYHYFDAFVILHGTDTMSYTSSALSFLLEDLGKTVILTGAQIPLSQLRNDAVDNLMGALMIAGNYIIPGNWAISGEDMLTKLWHKNAVCISITPTALFRGNRVSKVSSYDLGAFHSPNFAPLVNGKAVGIDIVVNWNDVLRQTSLRRFRAHKEMSPHVATLRLFPGITTPTIRAFLAPPVRGVVLETFGSGNAPQRQDLIQAFKGTCALTKLSYLLSKPEFSVDQIRKLMSTPLRGELTRHSATALSQATLVQNMENIQGLLSEFVRMSVPLTQAPQITISLPDGNAQDAAASWTSTAAEAASTEAALLPFLIHSAAARNDVEGIQFCLKSNSRMICLDSATGGSPLHAAALNGSTACVQLLLNSGALVHLRDSLGHTALYYAARKGFGEIVDLLVQAGALLSGSDGLYASMAAKSALQNSDKLYIDIWDRAGVAT